VASFYDLKTQTLLGRPADLADYRGKVSLEKVAISSPVPGSCSPNSLLGNPRTANPLSFNSRCSCSRPLYCGV
jgi:hypothetical protein